jgi:hypothetical protein
MVLFYGCWAEERFYEPRETQEAHPPLLILEEPGGLADMVRPHILGAQVLRAGLPRHASSTQFLFSVTDSDGLAWHG